MTHDEIMLEYYHVLTNGCLGAPGTNTRVNKRGEVEFYDGQTGYDGFLESGWGILAEKFADKHEGEALDEDTMVGLIKTNIEESVRIY